MLIVIALVVVAGGGGGAFFMLGSGPEPAEAAEAPVVTTGPPGLIALDTFLVNLLDDETARYLKCTLRLEIADGDSVSDIMQDELLMPRLRHAILTVLSSKQYDDILQPSGKDGLSRELKRVSQQVLEGQEILDVYFVEFVIQ